MSDKHIVSGFDRDLAAIEASVAQIGSMARNALHDATQACLLRDTAKARAVIAADLDTDQRYNSLFRGLLTHLMEDPRNITAGMHLHFVAKNLERIGDRATAIAEQVIFLKTGELPEEYRPKADLNAGPPVENSDISQT